MISIGPGCSGLLGFFTEHGPFTPNKNLSLSLNEFSWNKISNMLYVESPCSVGFSYSEIDTDYINNDEGTASDNYDLIKAFYDRFPMYKLNDLYISR